MEDHNKHCGLCNGDLWPQIIQCMCCERLFHWNCVGVDETIEETEEWWLCENCSSWIYPETDSDSNSPDEVESTSSTNRSKTTTSSKSNRSSKSASPNRSSKTEGSSSKSNRTRCSSARDPLKIKISSVKSRTARCVTTRPEINLSMHRMVSKASYQSKTNSINETKQQMVKGNELKPFPGDQKSAESNQIGLTIDPVKRNWNQRNRHPNESSRRMKTQKEPMSANKIRKTASVSSKIAKIVSNTQTVEFEIHPSGAVMTQRQTPLTSMVQTDLHCATGNGKSPRTPKLELTNQSKFLVVRPTISQQNVQEDVRSSAVNLHLLFNNTLQLYRHQEQQSSIVYQLLMLRVMVEWLSLNFDVNLIHRRIKEYLNVDKFGVRMANKDNVGLSENLSFDNFGASKLRNPAMLDWIWTENRQLLRSGQQTLKLESAVIRINLNDSQFVAHRVGELLERLDVNEWQQWTSPNNPKIIFLSKNRSKDFAKRRIILQSIESGYNHSFTEIKARFEHTSIISTRHKDPEDLPKSSNENHKSIGNPKQGKGISSIEHIDYRLQKHRKLNFAVRYVLHALLVWCTLLKLIMNWINMGWSTLVMCQYRKIILKRETITEKAKCPKVLSLKSKNIWCDSLQDSVKLKENNPTTPIHFIKLSSSGIKPPCEIELDGPYLRESWKESQRLTEIFWKRFVKEYLPTIARRTKWHKLVAPLRQGDLVLIVDENSPRNTYPKARILKTVMGSNGQVRRAKVEIIASTKSDSNGRIIKVNKSGLWRSAHKLAVLDVASKNGLAEPKLVRETGGSVGATEIKSNIGALSYNTDQVVAIESREFTDVSSDKCQTKERTDVESS